MFRLSPRQSYSPAETFSDLIVHVSGTGFAIVAAPALIGLGIQAAWLGINSRWFRITTQVRLGQRRLWLESDMVRDLDSGEWHLLQRRFLAPKHSESS